jgi:hypothetical protein
MSDQHKIIVRYGDFHTEFTEDEMYDFLVGSAPVFEVKFGGSLALKLEKQGNMCMIIDAMDGWGANIMHTLEMGAHVELFRSFKVDEFYKFL